MEKRNVRKYPRTALSFPVEFGVGENRARGRAAVLGGGGLFLESHEPLHAGEILTLRFRPAKHFSFIEATGRVCYEVAGKGFAVEFTEISDDDRRRLLRFIHNKTKDNRRFPRASLAAQIESQEVMSLAFARDVSIGGMFIETNDPLAIGSPIRLRFNLDDVGPIVEARAEVTYQLVKMGMGVQFTELAPSDQKRIQEFVFKTVGLRDVAGGAAK